MRILIAVHHFPPGYKGGAEWRAFRTANALLGCGHSVQVFSIERIDSEAEGLTWRDELYEGIPIRRLAFNLFNRPDAFEIQYKNPYLAEHLEILNREFQPDVFHLIGGYLISGSVIEAARQMNLPVVVSLTDYWWMCARISMLRSNQQVCDLPFDGVKCARCLGEEKRRFLYTGKVAPGLMNLYWRKQKQRIQKIEQRFNYLINVLNQADVVLSPSQFLREMYIRAGMNPKRIRYSRQGNSYAVLPPGADEKSPSDHLRLGYLGQIEPLKGVHVLVEAVRSLPDAPISLQIYGDFTRNLKYTARLQKLASGDPRIKICGAYLRHELSNVLRNLDVLVSPSIWYENSPNAILEAFAHRTPVIASRLGGSSEMVEHGVDGLLSEPNNAADLAVQIQKLLSDRDLLPALRAGIKPVKSIAEEMDELTRIYREIACEPLS